jgi:hypothetical protein
MQWRFLDAWSIGPAGAYFLLREAEQAKHGINNGIEDVMVSKILSLKEIFTPLMIEWE